jgi:hypothetical protein
MILLTGTRSSILPIPLYLVLSLSSISSFIVSLSRTFLIQNMSDIFINTNVVYRDTINEVIDDKDVAKHTTIPYKSMVPCDTYKSILYFNWILFRALKSSLKELIHLHSWEQMSAYWKSDILTDILPIKKGQPRIVCGVMLDPVQFLPLYLERFLIRREMEGHPLSPGHYSVEFKVES